MKLAAMISLAVLIFLAGHRHGTQSERNRAAKAGVSFRTKVGGQWVWRYEGEPASR